MKDSKVFRRIQRTLASAPLHAVDTIILHPSPHFDDVVAAHLLREFSGISGIEHARILFEQADSSKDLFWERLKEGDLLVGQGGGPFDEHDARGKRDGHVSSTSLVADFCGIRRSKDQALCDLIEQTTREDAKGYTSCQMNLGHVFKLMHRLEDRLDFDPLPWALEAASAYSAFKGADRPESILPSSEEHILKDKLFEHYELNHSSSDTWVKQLRFIIHEALRSCKESNVPFGLAYTGTLIFILKGKEAMREWMFKALRAEVERQYAYVSALMDFKEGRHSCIVPLSQNGKLVTDKNGKSLFLVLIRDMDNPEAARVAMSRKGFHAPIVVLYNTTTQILFNQRDYSMDKGAQKRVAKRLLSLEKDRWANPFPSLILNGSHSHPNVPPTKLRASEIARVIVESFQQN